MLSKLLPLSAFCADENISSHLGHSGRVHHYGENNLFFPFFGGYE